MVFRFSASSPIAPNSSLAPRLTLLFAGVNIFSTSRRYTSCLPWELPLCAVCSGGDHAYVARPSAIREAHRLAQP